MITCLYWARSSWRQMFLPLRRCLRCGGCATRFGPWSDPLHYLHWWFGATRWWVWFVATPCRYSMLTTAKFMVPVSLPTSTLSSDITECVDDISSWMLSNRLQLNADKTEVMWCSSTRRLPQLPSSPLVIAGAYVHLVSSVRDLGVFIDSDLVAATHVRKTVSRCFAALCQLRHLRRYVTDDCFRLLVVSFIHQRLTSGTSSWSGYQPIFSNNSSLYLMLRPVLCSGSVAMTTSPTLLQSSIGCVYHKVSTTKLLSWRFEHCMAWLRHTWIS